MTALAHGLCSARCNNFALVPQICVALYRSANQLTRIDLSAVPLMLQVSGKKALIDAGLEMGSDAFNKLDKIKCGVLIGTGMGGIQVFQDGVKNLVEKGPKKISPFFIPFAITNMGGALFGIETGFMGPNYSISTACATANYCFNSAAHHILRGDADMVVAGGSEAAIIPVGLG
eukprot:5017083-Pyramimonas_sp.AAC.1